MKINPRAKDPVDRHVGERIRLRRESLNISQRELSRRLGLTPSQIDNYERGVNKIGAGRLWVLSDALDVSVNDFFEGLVRDDDEQGRPKFPAADFITDTPGPDTPEWAKLVRAFVRIGDRGVRRSLIALVRTIASEEAEGRADQEVGTS